MKKDLAFLFRQLTQGVYIVGVTHQKKDNAFTAAWVMQVSFNPLLLALSINPGHSSYEMLTQGGAFSVNVLPGSREDLAQRFGQPATVNKLAEVKWHRGKTGAPILDDAMAYFDCEFSHECPAGDHVLVIGRVVAGAVLDPDALPMCYRDTGDMDGSSRLYPDEFI
ncbi:MAG: flavin reductase [Gammaproteobacteria bacterium]|nr:flavin reductase [Gammaproteobacteria bacterium]